MDRGDRIKKDITVEDGDVYVGNRKVDKAYRSHTDWWWFGVEKAYKQDSVIEGETYEGDQIWYGYVIGFEPEWGYFSEAEIERLEPMTKGIPRDELPTAVKEFLVGE